MSRPSALQSHGLSDRAVRNLFVFPVLALLIVFNVFPLFASLFVSFTEYYPATRRPPAYVGLDNYRTLLNDEDQEAWRAFSRTGALVIVTVGLQTLIGFAVALLLHRRFPGRGVVTALLLIPMMLSPAIMASFWKYIFDSNEWGVANSLLGTSIIWDGTRLASFWAVVVAEVWMWTPFMMLLSLAGLNSIPASLYEAAEVDRASPWFRFRHITLPLVMPLVLLGIIFRVMDTFRLFDTAYVLNGNLAGQPTTFVSVMLHRIGIGGSRSLGEATAMAYLMLIVAVALGNLVVWYLDRIRSRHA